MTDEDFLAGKLKESRKVEEPSKFPFHVGRYDLRMRDRMRDSLDAWPKLVDRRKPEFAKMDDFLSTTLFALYKPETIPVDPLTKDAEKMRRILDIAERMPEWRQLKERVTNNFAHSALATMVIGENVVFPEDPPGGGGQGDEDGEGEDQDNDGPPNMNAVRNAIAQAIKEANDTAETADTLANLWGNEMGEDVYKDANQLYYLIQMLGDSDRLKIIAKLLGRLKNQMTRSQMAKSTYVPEETVDIELGNDLRNMLPNGRILLAEEELNILFLLKYLQRALLQQRKEGREPVNYGPIVLMMDISGSMDLPLGDIDGMGRVTRLDWAVAVGLTLTILAQKQKRECYLGAFDYHMRKEFRSTDPNFSLEAIVEMLSLKGMGGTSFEVPLRRTEDIMREAEFTKADLVFITDGECHVTDEFLERHMEVKDELDFRTLSVSCGFRVHDGSHLHKFSNRVLCAENLVEADKASDVIFQIGS